MKIYIRPAQVYTEPVKYVFTLLGMNKSETMTFSEAKEGADVIVDDSDTKSIPIAVKFYHSLLIENKFSFDHYFKKECRVVTDENKPDLLATIFYMVSSFQEYSAAEKDRDRFGRFLFASSYQSRFKNIQNNLVQECMDAFCDANGSLKHLKEKRKRSRVFLSHDIDSIHGSFLQDGLWAIRRGRLDVVMKLVANEILGKPSWKNFDKIMKIHDEHDLVSTFFMIAVKGEGSNHIKNADYSIAKIEPALRSIPNKGMHKSCADLSFEDELKLLPFKTRFNRYHFLKFALPDAWEKIECTSIRLDASLGFAEHYGFRNSYGLPFRPYDIKTKKSFSFVEVPLHMMDTTFQGYLKVPVENTGSLIIDLIEKNKADCVLSLLWHNNYFTDHKYKGYLKEYKKILSYLVESKINAVTPDEIINEYGSGN